MIIYWYYDGKLLSYWCYMIVDISIIIIITVIGIMTMMVMMVMDGSRVCSQTNTTTPEKTWCYMNLTKSSPVSIIRFPDSDSTTILDT
jgi:hypothetical protein